MATLKHVRQGENVLPHLNPSTWNPFVDAAIAHRMQGPPPIDPTRLRRDHTEVLLKNSSGAAVDRYGVLGLGAPIITEDANADQFKSRGPTFVGATPATGTHEGKFAILLDALPDDKLGRAVVSGTVQCQINVNDAGDDYADIKNADATQLDSQADPSTGCAHILWKEAGTGTKWAVVRLGAILLAALNWTQVTDAVTITTATAPVAGRVYELIAPNPARERRYLYKFAQTYDYNTLLSVRVRDLLPIVNDAATAGTSSATVEAELIISDFDTSGGSVVTWATQPTYDTGSILLCQPQATAGGAGTLQAQDNAGEHCDAISDLIGGGLWSPAPAATYYGVVIKFVSAVAGGDVYVTQAAPDVYILPMPR